MPDLAATLAELTLLAESCAESARAHAASAPDDLLLEHQRQLAITTRLLETTAAVIAAEVAHRSRRELGYQGLAQRCGARTPEALVQQVAGASAPTARRLVRVGTLVRQLDADATDATTPSQPWLNDPVRAMAAGTISAEALEAIRLGLGRPDDSVSADALADASRILTAEAPSVTVERLAARARELRDHADTAGIAAREQARRDRRYLHLIPQADGMTRITGLLDPESAAVVTAAIDAATSPRRGGPRFTEPTEAARAERLIKDPRTTEQIALDALVELVDVGVRSGRSTVLGSRRATVRMLVTQHDLDRRTGAGFIEGQTAAVSIATVERHGCDGGYIPVLFDDSGQSLNLGRTQRLHNARQRAALSARDGGCMAPDCDRPASWCEVHHIEEYSRGGGTDLENGILLCRHHHMLMHNNNWRIRRSGGGYWLIPPPDIDPNQRPIPLTTKSPAARRMLEHARS